MPYATGRRFLDADSHLMELPGFLRDHAEASMRDRLPPIGISAGGTLGDALVGLAEHGGLRPERVDELVALGDDLIAGPKGYEALGACNATERVAALDQLGFERQAAFSSTVPKADILMGTCESLRKAASLWVASAAKPARKFSASMKPNPSSWVSMTNSGGVV